VSEDQLESFSKEYQKEQAIKNKVIRNLSDCLNLLSKAKLSDLASIYSVPGRSKMNKSQLAAALSEHIVIPHNIESFAVLLGDKEWDSLFQYVKGNVQETAKRVYGEYAFAHDYGLLFSFYYDDKLHVIMPDEVKKAFNRMDSNKVNELRQQNRFVIDYIHALVRLYGVISYSDVYEIINKQNPGQIGESDYLHIVHQLSQRYWSFDLHDNLFMDGSIESDEELDELLATTRNKPQYLPPKEQLLLYKDDQYFEMTPQLEALQSYVSKHLCHDTEMVTYLIDDIQLACSMESSLQDIIFEFERRNIEFQSMDQVNTVVSLITDVMNNTRLWTNRGYTPSELHELTGKSALIRPNQVPFRVLANQQATSVKIGRNEPCTCGSGKKYKKCCGSAV